MEFEQLEKVVGGGDSSDTRNKPNQVRAEKMKKTTTFFEPSYSLA